MKALFFCIAVIIIGNAFGQFKPRGSFDYFPGAYDVKFEQPVPAYTGADALVSTMSYGTFRARMGAQYTYKFATAYFDQHIYMNKANGITFQPLQAEWYAGVKFKLVDEVALKLEHMCTHPILMDGAGAAQTKQYGGYNMISISYGY